MKPFDIIIDLMGELTLKRGDKEIGKAYFYMDKHQMTVSDVDVNRNYRRRGYGTIIVHVLIGIAKSRKIPIYLYSLPEVVKFYEELGFVRLRRYKKGWYKGKRVVIDNLNTRLTFTKQTNRTDMVWIPNDIYIVHLCV